MLETHPCKAEGCTQACPVSHLMCVRHWRMVPADLRRDVFVAFREFKRPRRPEPHSEEATRRTLRRIEAMREAQAAAIAAVREKEQAKLQRIEELQRPLGL